MDARARFRALHEEGCFVIPNPWDRGTAKALASLGFQALATTSAGLAFTRALPDLPDVLDVETVLEHVADIATATDLPVNVDFQNGYASDLDTLAANVRRCVEAGASGLSIEDATGDDGGGLYDLDVAVERIRVAREAIDATGAGVLLTGRAECFLWDHPDPLRESVRRLGAYAEAGADVLYAPMRAPTRDDVRTIVEAVAPKPVNVLVAGPSELRVADLAELGVRRISVGSTLARVAWGAFLRAAEEIAEDGTFGGLGGAAGFAELHGIFGAGR
jgi:2-methylisocitrate lyase-like PEP mutase family enzyme